MVYPSLAFGWAYEKKTMDRKGTGRQKQKKSLYREDQGELKIHVVLTFLMLILVALTVKEYMDYYKQEDRLCSPHPIMLTSLSIQVFS